MTHVSRRDLFRGAAGLVVAFALPATAEASPASLDTAAVDGFLAIAPDGEVTIYSGKVDLGTGARAALRQIAAEELGVSPARIALVEGDTELTPDQGGTGGSTGIAVGAMRIRQAAATARARLIALAAAALRKPDADLDIADGIIRPRSGGEGVGIGALVGGGRFDMRVDEHAPLKDPTTYTVVGTSLPRPDLPGKITARHTYVHDHRVPGMVHARVIRPPAIGARVRAADAASIATIPGAQLIHIADFVAVAAPREWDAVRAARALAVTWTDAENLPGSERLFESVRATAVARTETLRATGDAAAALKSAGRVFQATYEWPIQSHGSMGPSCAVADIKDGGGTVWTSSQNTHRSRLVFAKLLGLAPEKLRLIYLDGAGSYGSNGNDDAAFEAALISRELGRPVRLQWMREDEHGWDPKGPPQLLDLRAALAPDGTIAAWETRALLPLNTPGATGVPLLSAVAAGLDTGNSQSAGLTSLNADPPYAIPDMRTDISWLVTTPLRPSNLRAPGKIGNVFAVEGFVDELAAAGGADPLAYRLARLDSPRGQEVLRRAAEMMGWKPRAAPPDRSGDILRGRGIAYVHYKQAENFVAMGMEVEVERASGTVRVRRVAAAHDCGMMVNPDAVRAQVEGCILQTLSRTLFEEVTFDRARVTSTDWASYPILTFPDVPRIEIALIDRRGERPLGAGEAATAPVAAALGNAVFDATGVRIRAVPLTPARVKAALAARGA